MPSQPRRRHSVAFKANVAVAAITVEKALIALAQEFDVLPNQIKRWRDGVSGDVDRRTRSDLRCVATACEDREADAGGRFYVRRARRRGSVGERNAMIVFAAKLSVSRQAIILGKSRCSGLLQAPPGIGRRSGADAQIDKLRMEFRFASGRMLKDQRLQQAFKAWRLLVAPADEALKTRSHRKLLRCSGREGNVVTVHLFDVGLDRSAIGVAQVGPTVGVDIAR